MLAEQVVCRAVLLSLHTLALLPMQQSPGGCSGCRVGSTWVLLKGFWVKIS